MRPTGVGPAQTWTINNHDAPVGAFALRRPAPWPRKVGGLERRQAREGADMFLLFVTPITVIKRGSVAVA